MSINFGKKVSSYSIKNDRKIKSICQPLANLLGIPYFTYFRIGKDGSMLNFANHVEQCDYYYSEENYRVNPYFTHPNLMRSGCVLLESTEKKDYLELMWHEAYKFQFFNPFLIVEKNEKGLEAFFFATTTETNISHHYINNLVALKKFGRYFVREAAPLIRKMDSEGLNIKEENGKAFFERDKSLPLSSENPNLELFLKKISPLTPQEQNCLDFFRRGNSAQATAAKMGISNRTVEHYFESIKSKFNVNSKWDLLHVD